MDREYTVERIEELLDEVMSMLVNEEKHGRVVDSDYIQCVYMDCIKARLKDLR